MERRATDGGRPLPFDRDTLGRMVREAWVRWAQTQTNPKTSWLVPYEELTEPDKEADRQIGEAVARWTLIGDAAAMSAGAAHGKLDRLNLNTPEFLGAWGTAAKVGLTEDSVLRTAFTHGYLDALKGDA